MRESNGDTVLLIGLVEDPHIRAVKVGLDEFGARSFFFDPSEEDGIPALRQLSRQHSILNWPDGRQLVVNSVRSIFCRYAIDKLYVNPNLPDLERFALTERLQAALSALRCIHSSSWVNDPWLEARADCKLYQTELASRLGLRTPDQIVTNSIADVRSFAEKHDELIIKSISDCSLGVIGDEIYCDRPIPNANFLAPYTAPLSVDKLDDLMMDDTPSLIQSKVRKRFDIRANVVDSDVFAYAITQQDGGGVDFRLNRIDSVSSIQLPDHIGGPLVELVRQMGLRFASCDLIQDEDGHFVFLEANVSGNYEFCDLSDEFRVTKALCRILACTTPFC